MTTKNKTRRWTLNSRPKVEIITIPVDGLFLYRNKVWRSLGKLVETSHSVTAQRVLKNEHGTEVNMENADFTEHLLVEPYDGEVPTNRYTHGCSMSYYQSKLLNGK